MRSRRTRTFFGIVAVVSMCCLFPACNGLFYYPDSVSYRSPEGLPCRCEEVAFSSGDGTPLHGWFLHAQGGAEAKGTVIHFHGNAQNLTSHVSFVDWLPASGFNVFVFDYRGYGRSGGKPSRGGIHEDCIAAIAYVRGRADVDPSRILIFGQSLGGACTLAAVGEGAKDGIRGIAVDSTFATYLGVANQALGGTFITYPLVWLLLSNRHSPAYSVAKLAPIPLLFFHGIDDPVVPISEGRALFDAAGEPKELIEVDLSGHTRAMDAPEHRLRLVKFFERCLERR